MALFGPFVIIVLLVLFLASSLRVLREYQRGVVFQLGRFWKVKGPGLVILVPVIQQMVRVELRTVVLDVPSQDVISRDNVSVKVNAVVYFRVVDPQKAIIEVENLANGRTMTINSSGPSWLDRNSAQGPQLFFLSPLEGGPGIFLYHGNVTFTRDEDGNIQNISATGTRTGNLCAEIA